MADHVCIKEALIQEFFMNVSYADFSFLRYDVGRFLNIISVSPGDISFLHYVVAIILNIYFLDYDVLRIVINKNAIDFDTYSKIRHA